MRIVACVVFTMIVLGACTQGNSAAGGMESSFEGALPIDGVITFKQ